MILSIHMGQLYPLWNIDPGRIAGQVVTGIGFLGAGAILRDKAGIHGLTTAASIWVVSALGLAVGMGFYSGALITAFFTLVALQVVGRIEGKLEHQEDIPKRGINNNRLND
jgi:putative Mg2+ transporter-C (MgtC) family protein